MGNMKLLTTLISLLLYGLVVPFATTAQVISGFSANDAEMVNSSETVLTQVASSADGSSDPASSVNPYVIVEAEDFHEQSGIQIVANGNGVGYIENGDYLRFDNVEFGNGPVIGGIRASS